MLRISKVLEVQPNYRVRVSLTDGTERLLNLEPLLPTALGGLRAPELFAQVMVVDGTLTWPQGVDLCPDVLLENPIAKKVAARFVDAMGAICGFDGMKIYVYPNDHAPPHLHVKDADEEAVLTISDGTLQEGKIKPTKLKKVQTWLRKRRDAILLCWAKAQAGLPAGKVDPP
ncbi:DUF4160 domain-containing protein [bacterium]|nr:DUF4160 domain-containing protein [bacterium]